MCVCVFACSCVVNLVVQDAVSFQEASEVFCRVQHRGPPPPPGPLPTAPDVVQDDGEVSTEEGGGSV